MRCDQLRAAPTSIIMAGGCVDGRVDGPPGTADPQRRKCNNRLHLTQPIQSLRLHCSHVGLHRYTMVDPRLYLRRLSLAYEPHLLSLIPSWLLSHINGSIEGRLCVAQYIHHIENMQHMHSISRATHVNQVNRLPRESLRSLSMLGGR
jgi:hypothetical protein